MVKITDYSLIKITGLDRAGKTSLVSVLEQEGYTSEHFPFRPGADVHERYRDAIEHVPSARVFDRGFITEHVYGPVMRTGSRLSELQFEDLLSRFSEAKGIVVWVSESAETLYGRLDDGDPWHAAVAERLDELLARQAEVMASVSKVAPVVQIIPTEGKDVRGDDFALGRFAE